MKNSVARNLEKPILSWAFDVYGRALELRDKNPVSLCDVDMSPSVLVLQSQVSLLGFRFSVRHEMVKCYTSWRRWSSERGDEAGPAIASYA